MGSAKNVFLKILQYSQENTLCRATGLQFYQKETPTLMFSREYGEIFKNTYFEEPLRMTTSYFIKKNRHSWRLNNSSKYFLNQ